MKIVFIYLFFWGGCITAAAQDSIHEVVTRLHLEHKKEKEKAGIIYDWIVANISYDEEAAQYTAAPVNQLAAKKAEDILRTKKGICIDFSNLAKALFIAAGIKCEVITGFLRAEDRTVLSDYNEALCRHAWNAIYMEDKWQLVDCTQGANDDGKGTGQRCNVDFLSPPEVFIFSHYPSEEKWQLLAKPVSSISLFKELPVYNFTTVCLVADTLTSLQVSRKGILHSQKQVVEMEIGIPYKDIKSLEIVDRNDDTVVYNPRFRLNAEQNKIIIDFPYKGSFYLDVYKKNNGTAKDNMGGSYLFATFLISN
jgi:hypothetical protein